MKKILFLGGAPTQIPPIEYALEQGHYVITCDYLPENPGHKLAHEYYDVSTTDKEAVLELAQKLAIDAIVAYASDPSAPTAAYVAENMNLPGNPYESVKILARKDLFRDFLRNNDFNVPESKSFNEYSDVPEWVEEIGLPVFVKPVDSSGSKGVTEVDSIDDLAEAFSYAMSFSRAKLVVVESKIIRAGYQVAGDGFVVDGRLVFRCWADEHFDKLCNGLVPIGQTFPTTHSKGLQNIAHSETQRLLDLLNIKSGALNFDFIFSDDGKFYFLELGPRNGGCLIPEVIRYATGIDLIKYTVDTALGLDCHDLSMKEVDGYWSSYMVHSLSTGIYEDLRISDRASKKIQESDLQIKKGDQVSKYAGSHDTLGTMILKYDSEKEMLEMIDNMEKDIFVVTR